MIIDGEKFACEACVRGHRVSNCQHSGKSSHSQSAFCPAVSPKIPCCPGLELGFFFPLPSALCCRSVEGRAARETRPGCCRLDNANDEEERKSCCDSQLLTCSSTGRPLQHINKKGRPVSQCAHCRSMRKSRSAHIKCDCGEKTSKCIHLQPPADGHLGEFYRIRGCVSSVTSSRF